MKRMIISALISSVLFFSAACPAFAAEATVSQRQEKAIDLKTWLSDLALSARGKDLEILGSPAAQGDVTVTLEKATAERKDSPKRFEYAFSGTIENNSDEGIMRVVYTFALLDENGEEFRSFAEVYDGEDTAIEPHTTVAFSHSGIRWGPQSVPAAVSVGISSVKTETELPPAHIPQEGEYLFQTLDDEKLARIKEEPPVSLSFHVRTLTAVTQEKTFIIPMF